MTVFATPLSMLPNNGTLRRPELTRPELCDALAGLASLEDGSARRAETEAYAGRAYDAENAPLKAVAEQVLVTLATAEDTARTAIGRYRERLAATAPVKAVISNTRLVERARLDSTFMWVCLAATVIIAWTEAKLLSKTVVVSGVFGLLPDSWGDTAFAWAFAAIPLFTGLVIRSMYAAVADSRERAQAARSLTSWAKRFAVSWGVLVASILGPYLLSAGAVIDDPFADAAGLADALTGAIAGTQKVLQQLSSLTIILLLAVSLITASTIIAALLISEREAYARAMQEDVRDDEITVHCDAGIAALIADQMQTDALGIGRLRGLIEALAADRDAFALETVNIVEGLRLRGEAARRTAILDAASSQGKVVDAGPLFARN